MDFYIAQFLTGLAGAASLFLVASGLSIIFGVTRIVNFAHGAFYMLGAYMAYTLTERFSGALGFWGSILLAAAAVALVGAAVEVVLLRRIYHAPDLFQLLATFDHGRVAAAPMALTLAHGRAVIGFVLDVRGAVPRVRLDADIRGADTADFRKAGGAPAPLQADFDGSIRLQGTGLSLSAAAAHASGEVRLSARGGRLQQTQAAVLGGDFVSGVVSLAGRSHASTPLRCAVARFQVNDGQARASTLRMATDLGAVTGTGGFDLASETLDLTLRPATSPMSGVTSVRIAGPLTRPRAKLQAARRSSSRSSPR